MTNQKKFLPKGWKRKYLESLATTGVIQYSAKAAGVSVSTVDRHRKRDLKFNEACDAAIQRSCEVLELAARERAVKGTLKPVFQGGEEVGQIREYSDTLLIFLMKGNMPEKYRDRSSVELGGPNGRPIPIETTTIADQVWGDKPPE